LRSILRRSSSCASTSRRRETRCSADSERAKPTHPAIIGISASQQRVRLLHNQAIYALAPFGDRAEDLRSLAHWLLSRQY